MTDTVAWERSLIGTALGEPQSMDKAPDVLPSDFMIGSHQVLWEKILIAHRDNTLTARGIIELLRGNRQLDMIGRDVDDGSLSGEMYITELLVHRSREHIESFAEEVIGASVKRQLFDTARILAMDAESEISAEELLDNAEQKIFDLRRRKGNTGIEIGDILDRYEGTIEKWRAGTMRPAFTFAMRSMRKLISFLEETDFLVIAGRPGEGKSSYMRYEAFEAAVKGVPTVIVNMENGEVEYARYLIAYLTGIDTNLLRMPKSLSEEQVAAVRKAVKTLRDIPLRIVSLGSPNVKEVVQIMAKLAREGYKLFFVDYIQLIHNGVANEVQDISITTRGLRGFALKYNVPVIAASQLNREIVHRGNDAEPDLADLRGSGSLEQDAVQVVFTKALPADDDVLSQYPENRDAHGAYIGNPRAIPIRLYVKKNRNGPVGKTDPIKWDKATNRFFPLTT